MNNERGIMVFGPQSSRTLAVMTCVNPPQVRVAPNFYSLSTDYADYV
jgi:hypothetical protein